MKLRLFRYRILLTCAGVAVGYFATGNSHLVSTSVFAIVLAALAFSVGYVIDSVAARLTPIHRAPHAIAQGHAFEDEEALRAQSTQFEESNPEDPDEDLGSASLSLACHGYNPSRGKGHEY
jgi:hypothetical protein